jgi:hypothetical protein
VAAARALADALEAVDGASRRLEQVAGEARTQEGAAGRAEDAARAGPARGAAELGRLVAAADHRAWLSRRAARLAVSLAEAGEARASLLAAAGEAALRLEAACSACQALERRRRAWEAERRAAIEAAEEGEAEDGRGGRRPARRP